MCEVVALVQCTWCTHCSDRVCAWSSRALVTALRVGRLAGAAINLLEVDDVCDHGLQLAAVLSARAR